MVRASSPGAVRLRTAVARIARSFEVDTTAPPGARPSITKGWTGRPDMDLPPATIGLVCTAVSAIPIGSNNLVAIKSG